MRPTSSRYLTTLAFTPLVLVASFAASAMAWQTGATGDDPPTSEPTAPPAPKPEPKPDAPPEAEPTPTPPVAPPPPPEVVPSNVAPPRAEGKPHRVHVIEDRFHEFSGTIRAVNGDTIDLDSAGKLRTFQRSRVLEIIDLVDPEPGQPGVVSMRDGRTYNGVIVADGFDAVEIDIQGIHQKLPRREVHHVTLTLTPRQFYEKARKEIPTDQYSARMRLAQYLYEKKMYLEAREELISILESIELHDAKELLRVVQAQLALQEAARPTLGPRRNADGELIEDDESGPKQPRVPNGLPTRLLSADDVNLIRVYEIDFSRPPRVTIAPELVRSMIEKYADSNLIPDKQDQREHLFREEPIKLVRLLFDLKARELYPQIRVATEPYGLALFRNRVHDAWLIGNCATSRCHGGVDAGRFFLHNRDAKSAIVRYTNLLILERLKLDNLPPLIDWDRPLDSLIVQYGLPRTQARFPHPEVPGWKPVFTSINRKLIEDFETWVKAMYQPRPLYPIEYEPPQLKSPDHAPRVDDPTHVPR